MSKTLLTLFLMFFVAFSMNAQEHMKFMGIPIDGKLSNFEPKLEEKGFAKNETYDNISTFKGKFTGKEVDVAVMGSEKTQTVCMVIVLFEKEDSWSLIKGMFNDYKELFTKKYGEPYNDSHFFSKPYYEGDGYELSALRHGKCTYSTTWNTEHGVIVLNMAKECNITIGYSDKVNVEIRNKEKQEKDTNDI